MLSARSLSHGFRGLALAAALGAATLAQADTLYSQPFAETPSGGWWASTPGGFLQFDSFKLSSDAMVTSVSWLGVDLNELVGATPISPETFSIRIYASGADGMPASMLASATINGSAGATSTGQQLMGLTLFQYTGALDVGFQAQAGTTYWLGISDVTLTNGNWFWAASNSHDNQHAAQINGAFGNYSDDLAFSLQGVSAVPEPASAMLMLAGLLGTAALRRRSSQA